MSDFLRAHFYFEEFCIFVLQKNQSILKNPLKYISKPKLAVIFVAVGLLLAYIFALPRNLFDVSYSTVVVDRNGKLLGARIADDEQWRFPRGAPLRVRPLSAG